MSKDTKIKKAMKLWRKEREINDAIFALGYRKLEHPVQQGWKLQLKLSYQFDKRPDRELFVEALTLVQDSHVSNTKDFMCRRYRPGNGESKWYKAVVKPKAITPETYEKLHWRVQELFSKNVRTGHRWGTYAQEIVEYVIYNEKMFTEEIIPNMVTKVKIMSPQLESEHKEIWNKIETHGYYDIICNQNGWSDNDDWNWESEECQRRSEKRRFEDLKKQGRYDEI